MGAESNFNDMRLGDELSDRSSLSDYIRRIQLKETLVGGFSRESVYLEMRKLTSFFQSQMTQLEDKLKLAEKSTEKLQVELDEAKSEAISLKVLLDEERKNKTFYEDQVSVLAHAVKAVQKTEEAARNEARRQATSIVESARAESDRLLRESRTAITKTNAQRDAVQKAVSEIGRLLETLHSQTAKTMAEVEKQQGLLGTPAPREAQGGELAVPDKLSFASLKYE